MNKEIYTISFDMISMYKILLIIIIVLLFAIILLYIRKINTIHKMQEIIIRYKSLEKRNFIEDIKYLDTVIERKSDYLQNIIIPSLDIKKNGTMINDTDYKTLLSEAVSEISECLSEEYKEILSVYIADLDIYIIDSLKSKFEKNIVLNNFKKVSSINKKALKDIEDKKGVE